MTVAVPNGVPKARDAGVRMKALARISAWALLACVIVQGISGWGITQTGIVYRITFGLVDRRLANAIHRASVLPLALFFLLHVLINTGMMISRKRPRLGRLLSWVLAAVGACAMGLVIYMQYFRTGG